MWQEATKKINEILEGFDEYWEKLTNGTLIED
jgi:hypothetical protein